MAHSVTLNWVPSTDAGAGVGYNVFRGTAAGKENATPLNSAPVCVGATTAAACTYTDSTVVAGQTYYYYVATANGTAVSAPSNEVIATIPLAAPTSLAVGSIA